MSARSETSRQSAERYFDALRRRRRRQRASRNRSRRDQWREMAAEVVRSARRSRIAEELAAIACEVNEAAEAQVVRAESETRR